MLFTLLHGGGAVHCYFFPAAHSSPDRANAMWHKIHDIPSVSGGLCYNKTTGKLEGTRDYTDQERKQIKINRVLWQMIKGASLDCLVLLLFGLGVKSCSKDNVDRVDKTIPKIEMVRATEKVVAGTANELDFLQYTSIKQHGQR